ncbi:putative membrane-anchored protein [Pseudochelatococcus lubricantis]|uniref:Membrane-anchored protein n=1 Tax=Pseudochelatococcus lubricantis TaxID=1538102 RepID=A0ABX0UY53_9HYPH|nr:hypothetical protein [Pseudochelatococcus lubricantis]NIJ56820.1 putative membrane-anchored protein [Pseudochelatococcus lubricantis]
MQGILYEESSVWLFLFVTLVLGGGAAWMTGRALAVTWAPVWQGIVYFLLLGAAVRFIHFALFHGTLLSLHYYLVDSVFLIVIGLAGFRYTRARQMTTQYSWLYTRTGPFTWRDRNAA